MCSLNWNYLTLPHWKRGFGYFLSKGLSNIYCSGISGTHEGLSLDTLSLTKGSLGYLSQVSHRSTSVGSKDSTSTICCFCAGLSSTTYSLNQYGIQPALFLGPVCQSCLPNLDVNPWRTRTLSYIPFFPPTASS